MMDRVFPSSIDRFSVVIIFLLFFAVFAPEIAAGQDLSGLTFVSSDGTSGSTVRVPLILSGTPEPIRKMDISLAYDPSLISALEVIEGSALTNTTLDVKMDRGTIHLTIDRPEGITDGTVAFVRFSVLATSGSSPLRITHLAATSAATRSPLFLRPHDGALTIIPGLVFSTTAGGQRIAVTPSLAGTAVTVRGNAITFTRDTFTVICHAESLAEGGGRVTGIINDVSLTSLPLTKNFSSGPVTGQFTITTRSYDSEGQLHAELSESVPPPVRDQIVVAGERVRLKVSTVLLRARVTVEGFSSPGTINGTFTLPAALLSPSANETIRVGFLKDDGTIEFGTPLLQQGVAESTLTVTLKQGYPSIAILLAQEVARPPSTTVPRTTGENIFSEGGQAGIGSIWGAMFLIFFLVAVVVIGVFYVHRRRGG